MSLNPFDLNLRHLRSLASIVARGSMSAGAEAVSLSQPALTQGLAKLERQLGVRLFERRSDGVLPTSEGTILADRSSAAFAHLAHAARSATRGSRGFARPEQLMTATQLRALLRLADVGSFVGAAQATGLSQPALHRAVRDLEQISAVALIERRGRGVVLTVAGRRLVRGVRLAANEIAAALVEMRPDLAEGGTRITIGAMPLSRALLLPRAIAQLAKTAPHVTTDIVEGAWRELVEPLRDGVIDLMIGALRPEPLADLEQRPLFFDRLVVVGRAGHPLAGIAAPSLDQLAQFPWIVGRPGTPLRLHWEAMFAGRRLPLAPVECGSVMMIRGVLRDSDFLTLVSPAQVALEVEAGILAQLGPAIADSVRNIGIVTRAGWRPTAMQAHFLALVRAAANPSAPPSSSASDEK
ncbi:MAG: LysR family transcriptional regulator [Sphingomonas sp. 28-66-16]|nr:MAG: LysR family transcriptional regulator [Sphingomonas sp. 28-66-16]